MSFLLRRTQGGVFVAKSGHVSSYTTDLRFARKFDTREEAERNRCVYNETIVDLETVLAVCKE